MDLLNSDPLNAKSKAELSKITKVLEQSGTPSSDYDQDPDMKTRAHRGAQLRPAAVLVPLFVQHNELRLLLTKRASHLKHHPGQIAFPGGKVDDADADLTQTALREALEEIALPTDSVDILGQLPPHETVTSYQVTPVVGFIKNPVDLLPEKGEVDEIFSVPFSHISDLSNYMIEGRYWQGTRRQYQIVPYGPYYIWGATARMLRALAERLST